MSHTPGAWKYNGRDAVVSDNVDDSPFTDEANVKAYGGYVICESVTPFNARLIAAAPDLLAACEEVVEWQDMRPGHLTAYQAVERVRAAIAKAKGESANVEPF